MGRKISLVSLLIAVCNLNISIGYRWETVNEGSELPSNIISLSDDPPSYVGRIFESNLKLPAEVFNSSYAVAFNPNTDINFSRKHFQVLTASENCHWESFNYYLDISENVVRVGTAWNGEPIYLGKTNYNKIGSILINSKTFQTEPHGYYERYFFACNDNVTWIQTKPSKIPTNAIEIDGNRFVARLYGPTHFIPASINSYACSTNYNNIEINAMSCEVLVGNSSANEYSWKSPGKFERVPQYAVVIGRTKNDDFIFVLRYDISISYKSFVSASFSELLSVKYNYEILVKNAV